MSHQGSFCSQCDAPWDGQPRSRHYPVVHLIEMARQIEDLKTEIDRLCGRIRVLKRAQDRTEREKEPMSDLSTYLIVCDKKGGVHCSEGEVHCSGCYRPDTRLQAIADAWQAFIEAPTLKKGTTRLEVDGLLYALIEEET